MENFHRHNKTDSLIYETILKNPGLSAYKIGKLLNLDKGTVQFSVDQSGYVYSEDDKGGLYVYTEENWRTKNT